MVEITSYPIHPWLADILPLCRYEDLRHVNKQVVQPQTTDVYLEELETRPNTLGKPTEMWYSQRASLAMGEYPQGILANIQKSDTDLLYYQRTTDTGRLPINLESLHQVASRLREPPYAERHVRWCERSETKVGRKLLRFPPTRFHPGIESCQDRFSESTSGRNSCP